MVQKIETMVKGMGEMSLDALFTWFPKKDHDRIRGEIMKSDNLELKENIVRYLKKDPKAKKKDVTIVEKEIDVQKTSKEVITNVIDNSLEKNMCNNENISVKELSSIIAKYNLSIEAEYTKLTKLSYENKTNAIKTYYSERFNLEENKDITGANCEFITLKHKKKDVEIAYLLIAKKVRKDIIDKIYKSYEFDTVYFCQIDDEENKNELPLGEYYYKSCNEIVSNYMPKYKIEKKTIEVYSIVKG